MKDNISLGFLTEQILSSKPPFKMETRIVAIDGCGGAGKTTLANCLSGIIGNCSVVHTDDFASWENPLDWYKRMIDQVLMPLRLNKVTRYQKYDWNLNRLAEWIELKPKGIIILEGVSSSRVEFREFLSFSIFVETDRKVRLRRGLERDGKDALEQWQKWMVEEDLYVDRDQPAQYANLVINGDSNFAISTI